MAGKKLKKRKLKRKKRLREQRKKKAADVQEVKVFEGFSIWKFLYRNILPLILVVIAAAMLIKIASMKPNHKKEADEFNAFVQSLFKEDGQQWVQKYNQGYKIIVITDKDIVHTAFDTLPSVLQIDWKKLVVKKLKADQLKNTPEKIKIEITEINYEPANVIQLRVAATFSRKKGVTARLAEFNGLEFVTEIIEDQGRRIYCLLGLRKIDQG